VKIPRRRFLRLAAGAAALPAISQIARAQTYPTRPVRIITPFSPGGGADVLLRPVAQKLAEKWKQPVVIENRAGGNTFIGTVAVSKGSIDGYTLLFTSEQTFILNPLLYATLPYSMKELDPIILVASIPHMLSVSRKLPVENVKELIELAKRKPDTLTYGTTARARSSVSPPSTSPASQASSSCTFHTAGPTRPPLRFFQVKST
jgi:tripartite-type tricarboxylate transporter receptor subunit TctC